MIATSTAMTNSPDLARSHLRVGVIGCGRIGRVHAEVVARQLPGVELVAVCDTDPERAEALGRQLGAAVSGDPEELIGGSGVDAIAICSSTDSHADLIVRAAAAEKAIFCEKPVSLELDELDRALAAIADAGVPFQVGFNRRFDPAHESVRAAVVDGVIGRPHLVRISSRDSAPPPLEYLRASGGIFLDMTVHDFDMARYIAGTEVVDVYARGGSRLGIGVEAAGDVDTALAVLGHEDGCVTAIDNSRCTAYGYDQRVEAFGSLGMAVLSNPPLHTGSLLVSNGGLTTGLTNSFLDRYAQSYLREWEAFVESVRTEMPTLVGVNDARPPLVIGLAAKRSLDEGRPIPVAEVEASAVGRPG